MHPSRDLPTPFERPSVHRSLRLAAALAVAVLALPAGAAKSPPKPSGPPAPVAGQDQGAFIDVMNVDVVNVDVYVTDKAGNPVGGLTADDFELREDNRPVAISNFYAVNEGTPAAAATAAPTPPPTPGAPALAPEMPEDQRLFLVVYIDNYNIRPFNRNRVFRRIREFLNANVKSDDRVMLVTYNRSFKQRVPFTSDPVVVNGALFEIEKETGYAIHRDSDRRDILNVIDDAESVDTALARVRSYAGNLYNDLQVSIDAMKGVVDSLGGLPGRKAVLYVSDGLPMVAAEDIYQLLGEKFKTSPIMMESRDYDGTRRFQELAAQANANRVTFYTIDAAGLRTMSAASVETQTAGASAFIDSQNTYNLQAPLLMLARDTGGKAIINTNDVGEQLMQVARDFRSYYSLGYQPAHSGDGRYHRIEVKLKKKGLQVRHRTGYRDKGPEQRMSDGTMAALLFGELNNPLGLRISFGQPTRKDDGNALVPIHLEIPLDRITLLPQADKHEARLRIFLAAIDDEGGTSPVQNLPLPISIPAAEEAAARQQSWGYDVSLLMRTGHHRVAIGLRDELGGLSSFISGGLVVSPQ